MRPFPPFVCGSAGGSVRAPAAVSSARFPSEKGVTINLEQPRLTLAAGTTEGVDRRPDLDPYEPAFLKHAPPACTRQATGNSIGPQVDVAQRARGNLFAVRDVGE